MQLRGVSGLFVGDLLLLGYRQGIDAEIVANGVDDKIRPAKVNHQGEEKVRPQVVKLCGRTDLGQSKPRQVPEERTADKWCEHHRPVRERLASQVRQDHLGCQAAKDKRHGQAEQDQVVVCHQGAVRREHPGSHSKRKDGHWRPFSKDRRYGKALLLPGQGDIVQAEGDVADQQGRDDQANPDISERRLAKHLRQPRQAVAQSIGKRQSPDMRAPNPRGNHDATSNKQALGRAVDDAQIQCVGVVCLPGGKEHGQARAEGRKDASIRCSQTHGSRFE